MMATAAPMDAVSRVPVGVVIGDPCGVGPEVVAKAWASGRLHAVCRPVLIGSAAAMRQAIQIAGLTASVRVVAGPEDILDSSDVLDIIDSGALAPADITPGVDNAACGLAVATWLDEADRLARASRLGATVMGPISAEAMSMAGVLDRVIHVKPGESYLLLASGLLRVAHLTDHLPLRDVSALITAELITRALHQLDAVLRQWGIAQPRIAVAGFNPHAKGLEDETQIAPGVAQARAEGVDVVGVVSPEDVDAAARSAQAAQKAWAATPFDQRASIVREAARLLKERAAEFTQWNVRECGSIVPKGEWEVGITHEQMQQAATLAGLPNGMMFPSSVPGRTNLWQRVPLGVVGVIAP